MSLANIFSPECIIIAPADIGDVDFTISVIADKVNVMPSTLGENIHLYGGVALVLQGFFQMLPMKFIMPQTQRH